MEKIFTTKKNKPMYINIYFILNLGIAVQTALAWIRGGSPASAGDSKKGVEEGAETNK
jgi:hypothetical protein